MIEKKKILKLIILLGILSTSFLSLVLSYYYQTDVTSGNCASGHGFSQINIQTNYTGDSITIAQGEVFDLRITATGQQTGDVWMGYAFWHTGSDDIQLPDTSPFTAEDNLVNQWDDTSYYYAQFAWQTVDVTMIRTFRINTTSLGGVETLTIQCAGEGQGAQGRYSNVISFTININDNANPDVFITAPSNNSYVRGASVPITATVDDNGGSGVNTVWAEITNSTDMDTVSMSGTEPNYSGSWDSTALSDGIYNLSVLANDAQSNLNDTEYITIKVDNTPPGISLDSIVPNPSNGLTVITASNSTADFDGNGIRATVSPPTGGDLYLDLVYQGLNIWNTTFTVTQNGDYDVSINATDIAGNNAIIGPSVLTGDLAGPVILIVAPSHSNGVTIIQAFNTTDVINGSLLANVSLPGGGYLYPPLTYQGANQWTGSFDVGIYGEGTYTIEINGTDMAGNIGYSTPYNIIGDLTNPTLSLSVSPSLSNGITTIHAYNNSEIILDGDMLANVSLPGGGYIYPIMTYQGSDEWTGTFDVRVYGEGSYTVSVNCSDRAGNPGYTSPEIITADITYPILNLYVSPNPSNGTTSIQVFNTTEIISGSIEANVSLPGGGYIYPSLSYQGSNEWTGSFDVDSYGSGTYIIGINGSDMAGNIRYNSTSILGDNILPNVNITSPTHGELVGGSITIIGTASGTGSNIASIFINNTIWGDSSQAPQIDTATGSLSGSFSFYNKSYITPGLYWVEIYITDSAGNVNSSVRFFNVTENDITPPIITLTLSHELTNGFINITVSTNEVLIDIPLLNITLPSSSVVYRPMYLIGTNMWSTNYTITSNGLHIVQVNATDLSNNIINATETFMGDITSPTITLNVSPNPSNGITTIQVFNNTEVVISILANISLPGGGYIYRTLNYIGANQWTENFTVTVSGTYTVYVNGTDLAGNVGYNSQSITGDRDGPILNIISIIPNPSDGLTTITVSNASADINGDGIRANVTTPSAGIIHINLAYQGANQWTGTFTVTEEGTYTIWINATDNFGQETHLGPSVVQGDFSNPIIIINSPENGSSESKPLEFDITIIDAQIDKMWYSIFNGKEWSEINFFTGSKGTINESLWNSLPNGELIIKFSANDSLGNYAEAIVGILKGGEAEEEDIADTIDEMKVDMMQVLFIAVLAGISFIGGIAIVMIQSNKRKKDLIRVKDPYEKAYLKYYGKKPKKKQTKEMNRYI